MASPVIKLEEHIGVGKLYNLLWSEIWDIWDIIFDSLSAAEMESSDIVIAALTKITREDIEAQLNAVSELPLGGADTPQQQIINYRFALSVGHRAMIMFRPPLEALGERGRIRIESLQTKLYVLNADAAFIPAIRNFDKIARSTIGGITLYDLAENDAKENVTKRRDLKELADGRFIEIWSFLADDGRMYGSPVPESEEEDSFPYI